MLAAQALEALRECSFPGYELQLFVGDNPDYFVLNAWYMEADTLTGQMEAQQTRSWIVKATGTKSELVATAFKCVLTSMEHRTREWFLYKNRAIFGPHFDVDALHAASEERPAVIEGCMEFTKA